MDYVYTVYTDIYYTCSNLFHKIFALAPPSIPTNVKIRKRKGSIGRCPAISISWSIPSNITDFDLHHYVMTINGETHYNSLLHPEPIYIVPIPHCNPSTISIHTVDRCRN